MQPLGHRVATTSTDAKVMLWNFTDSLTRSWSSLAGAEPEDVPGAADYAASVSDAEMDASDEEGSVNDDDAQSSCTRGSAASSSAPTTAQAAPAASHAVQPADLAAAGKSVPPSGSASHASSDDAQSDSDMDDSAAPLAVTLTAIPPASCPLLAVLDTQSISGVRTARWSACGTVLAVSAERVLQGGSVHEIQLWKLARVISHAQPVLTEPPLVYESWRISGQCRNECHKSDITALAWSSCGTKLASASLDGSIAVWSVSDVLEDNAVMSAPISVRPDFKVRSSHKAGVFSLGWRPDGQMLASMGNEDRTIQVWSIPRQGAVLAACDEPFAGTPSHMAARHIDWAPDGTALLAAAACTAESYSACVIQVHQLTAGITLAAKQHMPSRRSAATAAAWLPESRGDTQRQQPLHTVALGNQRGDIALYRVGQPDPVVLLDAALDGPIISLQWARRQPYGAKPSGALWPDAPDAWQNAAVLLAATPASGVVMISLAPSVVGQLCVRDIVQPPDVLARAERMQDLAGKLWAAPLPSTEVEAEPDMASNAAAEHHTPVRVLQPRRRSAGGSTAAAGPAGGPALSSAAPGPAALPAWSMQLPALLAPAAQRDLASLFEPRAPVPPPSGAVLTAPPAEAAPVQGLCTPAQLLHMPAMPDQFTWTTSGVPQVMSRTFAAGHAHTKVPCHTLLRWPGGTPGVVLTTCVRGRVSHVCASAQLLLAGCAEGRLHWLHTRSGAAACAPLQLGAPVAKVFTSTLAQAGGQQAALAITADGVCRLWLLGHPEYGTAAAQPLAVCTCSLWPALAMLAATVRESSGSAPSATAVAEVGVHCNAGLVTPVVQLVAQGSNSQAPTAMTLAWNAAAALWSPIASVVPDAPIDCLAVRSWLEMPRMGMTWGRPAGAASSFSLVWGTDRAAITAGALPASSTLHEAAASAHALVQACAPTGANSTGVEHMELRVSTALLALGELDSAQLQAGLQDVAMSVSYMSQAAALCSGLTASLPAPDAAVIMDRAKLCVHEMARRICSALLGEPPARRVALLHSAIAALGKAAQPEPELSRAWAGPTANSVSRGVDAEWRGFLAQVLGMQARQAGLIG